ncbi:alpha/beta hydrolase [Streptomyces coeruleorubidus]|uniref:alpha/beta hydrolase n=1 Tax=Streptomyces coeruleorubidus TaxID=116188 RepID=UPI003F5407F1
MPSRIPGTARRAVLALTAAGLAVTALPATAGANPGPDPLARYHDQRLTWKSCVLGPDDTTGKELKQAGARCADAGADQHAVYGVYGVPCVDDTVNAYLATGRLPGRDLDCRGPANGQRTPVPGPFPVRAP